MPRQATLCGAAGFLPLICQPWSRVEAKALLGLRFILSVIRHLLRLVSPALALEPLCSYPALSLGLYVSFQAPGVSSVVRFVHFNVVCEIMRMTSITVSSFIPLALLLQPDFLRVFCQMGYASFVMRKPSGVTLLGADTNCVPAQL